MGKKGTDVQVFVDRVGAVSVPHRLDGTTAGGSAHVPPKPTAGNDLAQAIDVSIQGKRGSKLQDGSGYQSDSWNWLAQTWRYRSSNTRGKPSKAVEGMSGITAGIGAFGNDDTRVSNNGKPSGSERRVIQNENGDDS